MVCPIEGMFGFWHKDTSVGVLLVIRNIKIAFFHIATQHHSQALYSGVYCSHLRLTCESQFLVFLSTLCSVTSYWQLYISLSRSIYTSETVRFYQSGLSQLLSHVHCLSWALLENQLSSTNKSLWNCNLQILKEFTPWES